MDVVSCPKCGRPRALGYRCPSCGDPAAAAGVTHPPGEQPAAWSGAGAQPASWAEAGRSTLTQRPIEVQPPRKLGWWARRSAGQIIGMVVVALAAIAVVVTVLMTAGGPAAEYVEQEAAVVTKGEDLAAKSLIRNAMTALDSAFVESMDYTAVTKADLQAIEPSITWVGPAGSGVCISPPAGAKADQSAVGWASTGPTGYELGTWSESGTQFGVKVDRVLGGSTYYTGGTTAVW